MIQLMLGMLGPLNSYVPSASHLERMSLSVAMLALWYVLFPK
jgi:hypothetical protein